jgi:hypothetical protein
MLTGSGVSQTFAIFFQQHWNMPGVQLFTYLFSCACVITSKECLPWQCPAPNQTVTLRRSVLIRRLAIIGILVFTGFLVMDLFMAYQINLRYQNNQATKVSLKLAALRSRIEKEVTQNLLLVCGTANYISFRIMQLAVRPKHGWIAHHPFLLEQIFFLPVRTGRKKDGRSFFGGNIFLLTSTRKNCRKKFINTK